jgi:hypothetical protein
MTAAAPAITAAKQHQVDAATGQGQVEADVEGVAVAGGVAKHALQGGKLAVAEIGPQSGRQLGEELPQERIA